MNETDKYIKKDEIERLHYKYCKFSLNLPKEKPIFGNTIGTRTLPNNNKHMGPNDKIFHTPFKGNRKSCFG